MPLNSLSSAFSLFVLMWFCIVACRLLLIFNLLGAPCLAVVGYMVLCSKSTSLTFRLHSSIGLNPVSLLSVSFIEFIFPALEHSISICAFDGILIVFGFCLYSGFCHCIL